MNNNTTIMGLQRKYFFRRVVAVILIGIPAELLALKILGLFLRICLAAGIF
jgi:hypothetical protein